MKKSIILLVFLCGLSLVASGQTENEFNKFWIGGSVGFNITADNTSSKAFGNVEKATTYKILPEFGYNFSDRWALGGGVGYSYSKQYVQSSYDSEYEETTKSFSFDIFARFSFLQGSVGKLFLDGSLQCSFGKREYSQFDETYETYDTQNGALGVRPGVMININDQIAFVGRFGFLGIKSQVTKVDDESFNPITYGLDLNMSQFQLGINITF